MCVTCMYTCVSERVRERLNVFEFTLLSTDHKPVKL